MSKPTLTQLAQLLQEVADGKRGAVTNDQTTRIQDAISALGEMVSESWRGEG